jgi:adenosine deaminase
MLHVHPTGTLQPATVERLLRAGNPRVSGTQFRYPAGFSKQELAFLESYADDVRYLDLRADDQASFRALFVLPEGTSDFRRFAAVFPLVAMLRQFPEANGWHTITSDFFKRAQENRVRYVEFTMDVEPTRDGLRELEAIVQLAQEYGVTLRINAAFDRAAQPTQNVARLAQLIDILKANPSPIVGGMDMSGAEAKHPALEAGQALYGSVLANPELATRLGRTLHAGTGDPRNMRDAQLLGAERVGHGTQALSDPVALEFAARRELGVEANLVSNVRLGYVRSFREHPFLDLLRLGLRVSLSTDDEGILGTSLADEFAAAITHTDITYAEVRQLVLNSIDTSFAAAAEKQALRAEVENDLRHFEELWPTVDRAAP